MLAAGAAAARVGTRFIATHEALEAGAHRVYVDALLSARGEDTVLTEAFSVGWPSAPHRVLTSCVEAASASTREPMGEMTVGDQTFPVPRWAVMSPNASTVGEIPAMALYAGQGVGAVDGIQTAAEVVADLVFTLPAGGRVEARLTTANAHPGQHEQRHDDDHGDDDRPHCVGA